MKTELTYARDWLHNHSEREKLIRENKLVLKNENIVQLFRKKVIEPWAKQYGIYVEPYDNCSIDYPKYYWDIYQKEVLDKQPSIEELLEYVGYPKDYLDKQPETDVKDTEEVKGERSQKTHIVKCWIQFKDDIISGKKKFEVRVNDRDYQVGDILIQQFWDNDLKLYSGGQVEQRIDYVLQGGQFGIDENAVVMSVSNVSEPDLIGKLNESQWNRITEKLPHCWETGSWDGKKSDVILVRDKDRVYKTATCYHTIMDGSENYTFYTDNDFELDAPFEWMEIPL